MPATLIVVTILAASVGIAALAVGIWLLRSLKWELVEDDQGQQGMPRSRLAWLKPWEHRPRLLTYRRDELGRFRRHRR